MATPLSCEIVDAAGGCALAVLQLCSHALGPDAALRPVAIDPGAIDPAAHEGWCPLDDLGVAKPCTDLVVVADAHAPDGSAVHELEVAVAVPQHDRCVRVTVLGDRHVRVRGGAITFEPPERFRSMPLQWQRAYGGVDSELPLELERGDPLALLRRHGRPGVAHPCNPLGRGWITGCEPARADGLRLPNLEDPASRLRPETLLCAPSQGWARSVAPRALGWVDPGWFPRCVFANLVPAGAEAGTVAQLRGGVDGGGAIDPRLWSGAAPGLALPRLHGGELVATTGLHPRGAWALQLPQPPPSARARMGTSTVALLPAGLHTACVDLRRGLVHTLWSSLTPLPRAWSRLGPQRRAALQAETVVLP